MTDETALSGVARDSGKSEISSPPDEPPDEGERVTSRSATADTDAPSEDWSDALQAIVRAQPEGATSTAGQLVTDLLESHPHYLDESLVVPPDLAGLGLRRSAVGHLAFAQEQWDMSVSPVLTGRRVILAMALDPALGRPLVESGVLASLVERWRPKIRTGDEQKRLIWDLLSDQGRQLADEQPLLAAALGAPSEWAGGRLIELPAKIDVLAWSPSGDRLAMLAGGVVHEARRDGPPRRITDAPSGAVSLGWSSRGVVALCIQDGVAQVRLVADGSLLAGGPTATTGLLSGDGSRAWLSTPSGLARWTLTESAPVQLGPPAHPLAVDWTGDRGLVSWHGERVLVTGLPGGAPPPLPPRTERPPGDVASAVLPLPVPSDWPTDGAPAAVVGPLEHEAPSALTRVGRWTCVASRAAAGGADLAGLPELLEDPDKKPAPRPIAWIATGQSQVDALASDQNGTLLAVGAGHSLGVWSLRGDRRPAGVPRYDSDRPSAGSGGDLVDADRDALALAALITSEELEPPMAVGLFGDWGSGKSFVLDRIEALIRATTDQGAAGNLRRVPVVRFNAWHYAETNLWASLVDEVLREIGEVPPPVMPPEVASAESQAAGTQAAVVRIEGEVGAAERELLRASRKLTRRRRWLWGILAAAIPTLAAAILAFSLGATKEVIAGVTIALGLLSTATAALANAQTALKEAQSLAIAGRSGLQTVTRLTGGAEASDVRAAAERLASRRRELEAARAEADIAQDAAVRARAVATSPDLGAVLLRVSNETEYRDQLSLVSRTRERFKSIDEAVTKSRKTRSNAPTAEQPSEDGTELDRVVVMIDDLDRCAPEKVVTVLEAVHLLFDFRMFVVLLAVDTRWLEQSLRIRYRKLLGSTASAAPSDYLEKIIQVPLNLLPLNEELVRRMLFGLTGAQSPPEGTPPSPPPRSERPEGSRPPAVEPEGRGYRIAVAPRPQRPPLPPEILQITPEEAAAMSAVAPLLGTTPRTVKRFVNTYRLLKGRAIDAASFDRPRDGLGDHQVVAFLLAVVTGQPTLSSSLLRALARRDVSGSLEETVAALDLSLDPAPSAVAKASVENWLRGQPHYARAPARRFSFWAVEVGRFSFTNPNTAVAPRDPVRSNGASTSAGLMPR